MLNTDADHTSPSGDDPRSMPDEEPIGRYYPFTDDPESIWSYNTTGWEWSALRKLLRKSVVQWRLIVQAARLH
eukprot:15885159-Heterocapsa_arctica.AAC.1